MKIQVTQTLPNGQVTQQVLSKDGAEVLKIQAQPGVKLSFNLEGAKSADAANANAKGKTGNIKKVDNNLVLESEGEALVEVTDFYSAAGASVGDVSWSYEAQSVVTDQSTIEAKALATEVAQSNVLLSPILAGVGLAAIGVSVLGAGSSAAVTPVSATTIAGAVVLGPLKTSNLIVKAYKANGEELTHADVNADGTYSIKYTGYTGAVTLKLTGTATYTNEAGGVATYNAGDTPLRAVTSGGSGAITANINPLTEIAATKLVTADAAGNPTVSSSANIAAVNMAVAKTLLGDSTDITKIVPDATAGDSNGTSNTAGKMLAIIAAAEQQAGKSTHDVITAIALGIKADGSGFDAASIKSTEAKDLLASAASQAFQNGSLSASDAQGALRTVLLDTSTSAKPAVMIMANSGVLGVGKEPEISFVFNQDPGLSFDLSDVDFSGGVLSNLQGSGVTRTATFAPSGVGDGVVSVAANKFTSGASTTDNNTASNTLNLVVDTEAPSPSIVIASGQDKYINAAEDSANLVVSYDGMKAGDIINLKWVDVKLGDYSVSAADVRSGIKTVLVAKAALGIDGVKTITASVTDAAGNVGNQSIDLTLDTAAPAAPTSMVLASDTGVSVSDWNTSNGLVNVSLSTDTNKWQYSTNGGAVWTDATGSSFTLTAGVYLTNLVQVKAFDKAGNSTVGQIEKAITIDATAPTVTSTSFNVVENATALTGGGALIANESVTWSFGTGDDTALFSLTNGVLSLAAAKNYEVDATSTHSYKVNMVATDTAGNITNQAVTVNLTDVNEAPTVANALSAQTFVVGGAVDTFVVPVSTFADVDAGDVLTYSAKLADGTALPNWLSFDAATHAFSGNPTANGSLSVRVTATDKGGLSTYSDFTLASVTAPVVQSFTVADGTASNGASLGKSGEALSFVVTLSEAVTTTAGLTAHFSVNGQDVTATSVAVTGTNTITFTGASVPGTGNGTAITLTSLVADSGAITANSSKQPMVAPTAAAVAYAGYTVDNTGPAITTSTLSAAENGTAVGSVAGTDASNSIAWSLDGTGADDSKFSISSTGVLSLAATKDFETPGSAATSNAYTVKVKATDAAGNASTKDVTVNVTNVNEAPTVANAIADQTFVVGGAVDSFTIAANAFADVDAGTTLTYTATLADGTALPSWLSWNAGTRTFSGDPTTNGTVTVKVTASDGAMSVSDEFVIHQVSAPSLHTNLAGVNNLDVTSKLVLDVGETVTAVAGKKITITDLGTHTNFHNEATTNSYELTFRLDGSVDIAHGTDAVINSTTAVKISGTGADTRIVIDLPHDLDFSSNYSLAVETGAFLGSTTGQASVAFTTAQFSTVAPDATHVLLPVSSTSGASQSLSDAGVLQSSYTWLDMDGWGSKLGATTSINLSSVANNKYAFVTPDYVTDEAAVDLSASGLGVGNINLTMTGFGANNLVYFDDLGRNEPNAAPAFDGISIAPTESGVNMNIDASVAGDGGNLDFIYTGATLTAVQQAAAGGMIGIWQAALNATHAPVIYG